jgi:hypothetical protein
VNNALEIENMVEYDLDRAITMDELLSQVKEDIHIMYQNAPE